jgi:archaemetzincin
MKWALFMGFFLGPFPVGFAMDFKPPPQAERVAAIGSTAGLPETHRLALERMSDFEPIPPPKPGDWLAIHPEEGQTFDDYIRSRPNKPSHSRCKIYLQPLGDFPKDASPALEFLQMYAAAYFQMETEVFPPVATRSLTLTISRNHQILTYDVLAFLKKKLPADAICFLAVTMEDLYPGPAWNFVFGQASLHDRVGVFSSARYDPAFYGRERGEGDQDILLQRSLKVLAHETAHMFSLTHCIYFRCIMNGSNHLQESDSRPMHLCPVCLHKLQFSIGFDVVDRYRRLLAFYHQRGYDDEARWVAHRLQIITGYGKSRPE